ncbi:MAG: MFS transporter [Rhodovibrionaceae bacterium]
MAAPSQAQARGHLIPLLASAGILLAGNGLQVTLVAVRANIEGFPITLIGLLGTVYYIGTILGCLFTAGLIKRSGHIRIFAALAALAAVCTLSLVIAVDIWVWIAARMLTGFCFSGLSMVIESWLNAKAANADRGRVFSLYRLVDLTAVTGAQFLLPAFGAGRFTVFGLVAILFCLALIPVSLSSQSSPTPPDNARLRFRYVWAISPVGCIGCLTIGFTNGAFRTLGPVFAQNVGMAVDQVALFVSAGIFGGAVAQYPFGWFSDRYDRRLALMVATAGAALAGLFLTLFAAHDANWVFAGAFLFGLFAIPLYSLSIAHANDHARPEDYVELSGGLILFFGIGAAIGPSIASTVIDVFGGPALFTYTTAMHLIFLVFVAYRMTRRAGVSRDSKTSYVSLLRTSPAIFKLGRKESRK